MISEAFNEGWIDNTGMQPVDNGVFVDFVYEDVVHYGERVQDWTWDLSRGITRWRLHVPSKLPQPTRPAPPMPTIKPPKVEAPEPSRVVQAFNRMTGHNITDDNLNTLKVLLELFSNETFGK